MSYNRCLVKGRYGKSDIISGSVLKNDIAINDYQNED